MIEYLQDMYESELRALRAEYNVLAEELKRLKERLHTDSHNSNKPPSSDGPARRPYQRRAKSKRPHGGQPGHEGSTLQRVSTPDTVTDHRAPERCQCGCSLRQQGVIGYRRRQVFDIPPARLEVHEHRALMKRCPSCGRRAIGQFPAEAKHAVQYGPRIRSLVIYLKDYALLPYQRLRQLGQDLFGISLSTGTVSGMERECAYALAATVESIRCTVAKATIGHFDETGVRVEGKVAWLHTASTTEATYYRVHRRRGREALDEMGILGDFSGVAMHDGWQSYAGYGRLHGLCNAHHLRELTFLWEEKRQRWAFLLAKELRRWKRLVDLAKRRGQEGLARATLEKIDRRYEKLLQMGRKANPPPKQPDHPRRGRKVKGKALSLVDRLWENREHVLRFTRDFRVPFDNNQAERDLRMMKVQQKISGTFRSWRGAEAFAIIRSYVSTIRKRRMNVIEAISSVFAGAPLLSPEPQPG